ncbi:MAG: MFS transporter, partial [Firmicutes bacterium]|nr:MFS transporter [Bacillota bacterium]
MDSRDQERVTFGQVLSRRDFFRVWSAHTVSLLGDRLTQVAIMIYVLELSGGSAALVSLSLAAPLLPYVLLGPFAGVFVERWDKRKVMVVCDLARAA